MLTNIDTYLASFSHGSNLLFVLLISLVLGLRHASDPDHLVAVTTMIVGGPEEGNVRAAARLGTYWGAGHATSLVVFGLPIMFFRGFLPEPVQQAAEAGVGVIIAALAIRLLVRWKRGAYHAHAHQHAALDEKHAHLHKHEHGPHDIGAGHSHPPIAARSPLQAYGLGVVHGIGGSAGVCLLLLATIPDLTTAVIALLIFAAGTAVSMTAMSSIFGRLLTTQRVRVRFVSLIPAFGVASLVFAAWYSSAAYSLVPYPF